MVRIPLRSRLYSLQAASAVLAEYQNCLILDEHELLHFLIFGLLAPFCLVVADSRIPQRHLDIFCKLDGLVNTVTIKEKYTTS